MVIIAIAELDELLAGRPALPRRLGALLARSSPRPLDAACWLAELVAGRALASAPLTRRVDAPGDCAGTWLRADPVALTPDLNAVWIRPGARLEIDSGAARELAACLAEEGLDFDLPHPERGYLRLESLPECRFVPPGEVQGESLDYVLPSGPDARTWRRLLNECQVLLHQYAGAAGGAHTGGLWFWGGGCLPDADRVSPRVRQLIGDDPVLCGLAEWLALERVDSVASAAEVSDAVVEWPLDRSADAAANLERLERWLAPLWRRLRQGRLDALELAGPRRAWRLTPGGAWRVWRRPLARPE